MGKVCLQNAMVLLLMALLGCNANELVHHSVLDGDYEGWVIRHQQVFMNGDLLFETADTTEISVSIWNAQFTRPPFSKAENCTGAVAIVEDKVSFAAEACPCFCDCLPYVDCEGDIILGQHYYESQGDTLKMWSNAEFLDTTSVTGAEYGSTFSQYYELYRF